LVARLADRAPPDRVRWFGAAREVRGRLPDDAGLLTGAAPAEPAVGSELLAAELTHVSEEVDGQHLELRFGREVVAVDLPMPGVYNAYNAAAALGVASLSGLEPATAAKALTGMEPAFGRGERIPVGDAALVLLLVKNPSSFTQVIRTLLARGEDRAVLLAINDNFADGRDVSWLWDVDFEALRGRADRITVTGLRATDLALRLKYTEIESRVEEDPATALDDFIGALAPGETGFVVPTYTAMLELRKLLQRRADLKGFWE
jgi:UDP-N-acetylmuramyl tripeptide synthase